MYREKSNTKQIKLANGKTKHAFKVKLCQEFRHGKNGSKFTCQGEFPRNSLRVLYTYTAPS